MSSRPELELADDEEEPVYLLRKAGLTAMSNFWVVSIPAKYCWAKEGTRPTRAVNRPMGSLPKLI